MKYRIAGIAAMVLVLLAVFLADNVDTENPEKRVHQHLTARQPDAGCDCDAPICLCWSLIPAAWQSHRCAGHGKQHHDSCQRQLLPLFQ